ncbi:MAG: SUMF1/EgtB/PvdO family nonheme iron enzyme [Ardenticatenaceae bacterium]|nr:SUMF1/EgtB/PvdO family nonheme iron enzyme [Ardenticatenaceae bacterium]
MTSADPNRQKLTQLRKLLIQHFSLDELRVLCFDLGLEYEELPGDTRTTKMHGLIEYLQRRGELPRLLNEAVDHRPNVAWPSFSDGSAAMQKDAPAGTPKSFIHEKTGLEMLLIPAGEFLYGEEKELKFLPNFWIAKTPVTNAHYAKFVVDIGYKPPVTWWENGKYPPKLANHPVVSVSWYDVVAYAQWAGLQLPTEQQWEKAARGQDGREYPWGNEWRPYCNTLEAGIGATTPVGYYSPFGDSPYGCVDMSGNVCEWTYSWVDEKEKFCVLRGGSFFENQEQSRVTYRGDDGPNYRFDFVGFRVTAYFSIFDF